MTELSDNAIEICKDRYFWENESLWEELAKRQSVENAKNETKDVAKYEEDVFHLINDMAHFLDRF